MANEILSPNYILPDNEVWLLKGVPLENNYEDTIIWQIGVGVDGVTIPNETPEQAKQRQFNYFTAIVGQDTRYHHLKLPAMTYLREGRKYLRVDLPYTRAIQYNYLIFKNNGAYKVGESTTAYHYETRYYYAFITSFEYINDKTTVIHYEIDLLQTYNFDYELKQCFIEREHSATDVAGDNLVPEKLELGEKIVTSEYDCIARIQATGVEDTFKQLFVQNEFTIIVAATVGYSITTDTNNVTTYVITDASGHLESGVYTGVRYNYFDITLSNYQQTLTDLNNFLLAVTNSGKESSIVAIYCVPSNFYHSGYSYGGDTFAPVTYNWDIPIDDGTGFCLTREWSYSYKSGNSTITTLAKNKKLYTQPFTDLIIYNGQGEISTYGFEYFRKIDTKYIRFKLNSVIGPNLEINCVPYFYKGATSNFIEKSTISNFPQCAYTIDAYRAWIAQNKYRIVNSAISNGLSLGISATLGNPIGMAGAFKNLFSDTANILTEAQQHSILPPQIRGNQTPYLSLATDEVGFRAFTYRPKDEFCKIIDDYFDLYGYATHEVKIPNRTVRPTWCYTKTVGCRLNSINRGIPADVDDAIRKIYDNGIRFWKDPAKIGNYTYSNAPSAVIP